MRNRSLHDALRDFALEAAALLSAELDAGAELSFDVDEAGGRRAVLYSYRPLTAEFIGARWIRLRLLPSFLPAARVLGSGAAAYLRVRGAHGDDAEPALRALLERLYEDATGFEFPEERFERVYAEVEATLYEHAMRVAVVAPLRGLRLESDRVELGDGLALVRGDCADAPPEAVWGDAPGSREAEPNVVCVIEEDADVGGALPLAEAGARLVALQTALRLFKAGGVALGPLGWARADGGAWRHFPLAATAGPRGAEWRLARVEEDELREFLAVVARSAHGGAVSWALARFEMGCERPDPGEGLSDHLLALGALLDASDDAGRAGLALRLAALCAEEGDRRAVQRRVELAFALERFAVTGGAAGAYVDAVGPDPPAAVAAEIEHHLRALLRDVLCGYLDPDLRSAADDILLAAGEPFEIHARDLRRERAAEPPEAAAAEPEDFAMATGQVRVRRLEPRPGAVPSELDERAAPEEGELEPVTTEFAAVPRPDPAGRERRGAPGPDPCGGASPDEDSGVTHSTDWDFDEDPESYSAPV